MGAAGSASARWGARVSSLGGGGGGGGGRAGHRRLAAVTLESLNTVRTLAKWNEVGSTVSALREPDALGVLVKDDVGGAKEKGSEEECVV